MSQTHSSSALSTFNLIQFLSRARAKYNRDAISRIRAHSSSVKSEKIELDEFSFGGIENPRQFLNKLNQRERYWSEISVSLFYWSTHHTIFSATDLHFTSAKR